MLKSSILCASLMFVVCATEEVILKKPTWTKQIEFYHRHHVTVDIGSHLFTISHNNSHVYVNSTDKKFKTCMFEVTSFANDRIEVGVLGNERKVVAWGIFQLEFIAETVKVLSSMILIDLWQCNYKKIQLLEDQQSRYLHRLNFDLTGWQPALQVVTYYDSFDVFFGGSKECSPCRFDYDGDKIEMQYQLKAPGNNTFGSTYIEALDLNTGFRGYFQIHQLMDHSAIIKLLDSQFKFLKQVRVEHRISKVFINRGKNSMIGICYVAPSPFRPHKLGDIYCKKYDYKLQLLALIDVPLDTKYYPVGFTMTLDTFGNMFVTCETSHNNSTRLALYRFNKNVLVESFDLGPVHTIRREILFQRPVLVNREFCFVTTKKFHINRVLKCIIV